METIREYLAKTESATRKLFEGVESYLLILRKVKIPLFVHNNVEDEEWQRQFEEWTKNNEICLQEVAKAQQEYADQIFAQATL